MLYVVFIYLEEAQVRRSCLYALTILTATSRFGGAFNVSVIWMISTVRCVRRFLADEMWIKVGSQEARLWLVFGPHASRHE